MHGWATQSEGRALSILAVLPALALAFLQHYPLRPPSRQHLLPLAALRLRVQSANVLAPIYKRLDSNGTREAAYEDVYLDRNERLITHIVRDGDQSRLPDVLCLQEFWAGASKLKSQYTAEFCDRLGYRFAQTERTNQRGDAVACFVSPRVELVDQRPILFYDCGDRVAIMVRVRIRDDEAGEGDPNQCDVLVVNTHLLFPHNEYSTRIRLREVSKILGFIDKYKAENHLGPLPIIITGDFNGSPRGQVATYIRDKGFVSTFDQYNKDHTHKLAKWVSHLSHRQQYIGVDYIYILQPQNQTRPLAADWRKLVFREIQKELPQIVRSAFKIFDSDDNRFIDPEEFKATLKKLGFSGEGRPALTNEEVEFLFYSADTDANGMIDWKEFVDRFWELDLAQQDDKYLPIPPEETSIPQRMEQTTSRSLNNQDNAWELHVDECFIEPEIMEHGEWPPLTSYNVSDHGFLTASYRLSRQGKGRRDEGHQLLER